MGEIHFLSKHYILHMAVNNIFIAMQHILIQCLNVTCVGYGLH